MPPIGHLRSVDMGSKDAKRRAGEPPQKRGLSRLLKVTQLLVVCGGAFAAISWSVQSNHRQEPAVTTKNPTSQPATVLTATTPTPEKPVKTPHTLQDLLKMSPEQLNAIDIAELNLACAVGLPGSEHLDVSKALSRLDEWAARVRYWTDQNIQDFYKNPGQFENSEAKFRVLLLISVLQGNFGVHYHEGTERSCNATTSKNVFIHGMIDDPHGGTCATMSVMFTAIGRRLGFPMKLVLAKTHVFGRWEDPVTGERFNIEGTRARFSWHPDSYYRNWPDTITDAEVKQGWYMKSLTPAEELAMFLQNRGYALMDNGRFSEAEAAFTHSRRLAPQDPLINKRIASARRGEKSPVAFGEDISRRQRMPVRSSGPPHISAVPPELGEVNSINRANQERQEEMAWRADPMRMPPGITPPDNPPLVADTVHHMKGMRP